MHLEDINDILDDEYWRTRIKNSILSICEIYDIPADSLNFSYREIHPDFLYIAAIEECDIARAREHLKNNYGTGTPVTVIKHGEKHVLFMGSNRSLQYLLQNKNPNCLVVELPSHLSPKMVSEANITLSQLYRDLQSL